MAKLATQMCQSGDLDSACAGLAAPDVRDIGPMLSCGAGNPARRRLSAGVLPFRITCVQRSPSPARAFGF